MTRLLFLTLAFFISQGSFAQKPNDQYHLVWSDEFNDEGAPSSQNWVFEKGFVRNNEIQYYQASNAYCSNGILTIEARREKDKLNPDFDTNAHDWRKKTSIHRIHFC